MAFVLFLIVGIIFALIAVLHQATVRRRTEYSPPWEPARAVVPELHTVRFLHLPFGTFLKMSALLAAVTALVLGLATSVVGLCGWNVTVDFFTVKLRGKEAILAAPFLCPLGAILWALIISPLAWPLTNWLLRRTRGVDVTGTIANLPEE